jgi:hypothetical protein
LHIALLGISETERTFRARIAALPAALDEAETALDAAGWRKAARSSGPPPTA